MSQPPTLLTLNCHEAWVYQLGYLDMDLHIIDGLPGRYCPRWDTHVRPVPPRAKLITMADALSGRVPYHCIIAHSLSDLLDVKALCGPRLLVIHGTVEGRLAQEGLSQLPDQFIPKLRFYLKQIGAHVIGTSQLKAKSWGLSGTVVKFSADPEVYPPWTGLIAAGIRVANQISVKREVLLFDFHEAAFSELPVRLVGHNPDMQGVEPSESWDDLKALLSSHRFFIHTAHPQLEDGYNMATLEAMAAGLPVLGNRHPSSPIEHGMSGFLSDSADELRRYAEMLLRDRELAREMGEEARKAVQERFSVQGFVSGFRRAIESARVKWKRTQQAGQGQIL